MNLFIVSYIYKYIIWLDLFGKIKQKMHLLYLNYILYINKYCTLIIYLRDKKLNSFSYNIVYLK